MAPSEVIVGVVGRPHGVRGEVSVDVRTDFPARRFAVDSVLRVESTGRRLTVVRARPHQQRLLVTFDEVADRNDADTLRGELLMATGDTDDALGDALETDEYHDGSLVGLVVHDHEGSPIGTVRQVQHNPGQDLLVVATDHGQRLIPFVRALVPEVDLVAGTCTVADVPGLIQDLDEEDAE